MFQKYDRTGIITECIIRSDYELSSIWIDKHEYVCYSTVLRELMNNDGFGGQIGVNFDELGIITDIEILESGTVTSIELMGS